jgi:hypothetical protein
VSALSSILAALGASGKATSTAQEAAEMAKSVFGDGAFGRIAGMIRDHAWGDLVDLTIRDIAMCIAIADPALATVAPMAASLIVWARHHPESVDSPAMQKAAGNLNSGIGA